MWKLNKGDWKREAKNAWEGNVINGDGFESELWLNKKKNGCMRIMIVYVMKVGQ